MNGFSVIIPTYNRAELLRKALESVQALRMPPGWTGEILVIDNNSTDSTPLIARESARPGPLPVRHIIEANQGLNHARNRGLHEADFEHLIYLDDDMQVDPGWLQSYVHAQSELTPDAVVGPVEPMFEETPPDWLSRRMIESVTSSYSQKGDNLILLSKGQANELPGCNFAVLKHVALEVGGFHPSLDRCGTAMLAGGDSEFGERLAMAGKRVAYSPGCSIRHLISRSKISRAGLRARWEGSGATRRAMMRIRGEDIAFLKKVHLTLRMLRLYGRATRSAMFGDVHAAFQWELEALSLRGLVFGGPKGLIPRVDSNNR